MAALWRSLRQTRRFGGTFCKYSEIRRYLLSSSYKCDDAWQKYLQSPVLAQVDFGELSFKMYQTFESQGYSSLIDMDIIANKVHMMDRGDHDLIQNLIHMFRKSKDAFPIHDSIVHGIVRGYLAKGLDTEILDMVANKPRYGLLPDHYTANLMMDHFLTAKRYPEAARVVYEMMHQEDFSDLVNYLLSVYVCTKHLAHTAVMDAHAQQADDTHDDDDDDDDEDHVWIAKPFIQAPHYDNHFDIQSDQYKLGKCLYLLGRVQGDDLLGRSLQLTGLALYNKFPKAISLLQRWQETGKKDLVMSEAVSKLKDLLATAPTRDSNAPQKDYTVLTLQDDILAQNLLPEEKERCTHELQVLSETLETEGQLSSQMLEAEVETYVTEHICKFESQDTEDYCKRLAQWDSERQIKFNQQLQDYLRKEKEGEITRKLLELQEKEETLRFFEHTQQIRVAQMDAPWERKKEKRELTLEEQEDLERERMSRRSAIRKKRK